MMCLFIFFIFLATLRVAFLRGLVSSLSLPGLTEVVLKKEIWKTSHLFSREMYSTLMEHLQSIQCLSILMAMPEYKPEFSCAAAMFGVIEATMHAAAATADQTALEQHHGKDSLPPLALNWSHVTGFLPLIGGCLTKWVGEILACDPSPALQVGQTMR